MAPETKAMLFALTSPHPSIALPDFNRWYDERHAPSRAACPGVHSVCRFHLDDENKTSKRVGDWTWLATYELEEESALQTQEYKNARDEDGDDESRMFAFLSRRVYRLLEDKRRDDYNSFTSSGKSRLMLVKGLSTRASARDGSPRDIEQLSKGELANAPNSDGWLRSSIWQLSTAADPRTWEEQTDVPKLMVLHEWEDRDNVRQDGALAQAFDREATGSGLPTTETALLKLWKQF